LTDIVAGHFDAGMRPGERVERDMIAVRVGEAVRGVIVAAPDYLARTRADELRGTSRRTAASAPFPERRDRSLANLRRRASKWKWRWRAA